MSQVFAKDYQLHLLNRKSPDMLKDNIDHRAIPTEREEDASVLPTTLVPAFFT